MFQHTIDLSNYPFNAIWQSETTFIVSIFKDTPLFTQAFVLILDGEKLCSSVLPVHPHGHDPRLVHCLFANTSRLTRVCYQV